jgi:hypothetical protein
LRFLVILRILLSLIPFLLWNFDKLSQNNLIYWDTTKFRINSLDKKYYKKILIINFIINLKGNLLVRELFVGSLPNNFT